VNNIHNNIKCRPGEALVRRGAEQRAQQYDHRQLRQLPGIRHGMFLRQCSTSVALAVHIVSTVLCFGGFCECKLQDDGSSNYNISDNFFFLADAWKMDYGGHDFVYKGNVVCVLLCIRGARLSVRELLVAWATVRASLKTVDWAGRARCWRCCFSRCLFRPANHHHPLWAMISLACEGTTGRTTGRTASTRGRSWRVPTARRTLRLVFSIHWKPLKDVLWVRKPEGTMCVEMRLLCCPCDRYEDNICILPDSTNLGNLFYGRCARFYGICTRCYGTCTRFSGTRTRFCGARQARTRATQVHALT
jgi:hypothetical protein